MTFCDYMRHENTLAENCVVSLGILLHNDDGESSRGSRRYSLNILTPQPAFKRLHSVAR